MQQPSRARLKATGEPVRILSQGNEFGHGQRYLIRLPPQEVWHQPRHQQIRSERLQFSNG